MAIRLRLPSRNFGTGAPATVLNTNVAVLPRGAHVTFHLTDAPDRGVIETHGHTYPVGNIRYIEDPHDDRHTLVECELADEA